MKHKELYIAIGVVAAFGISYLIISKKKPELTLDNIMSGAGLSDGCMHGMVKCENSDKCYSPTANYIIDPCS